MKSKKIKTITLEDTASISISAEVEVEARWKQLYPVLLSFPSKLFNKKTSYSDKIGNPGLPGNRNFSNISYPTQLKTFEPS